MSRGSDERQYNSPGIDIPITSIFRSKYGEYKEYHTSLDNFEFISYQGIKGGYNIALKAIKILCKKIIPQTVIKCEPFLSKENEISSFDKTKNFKDQFRLNVFRRKK